MINNIRALGTFLRDYHRSVGDGSLPDGLVRPDLPRPLRKIYLNFGSWTKPWSPLAAQDYLLPADKLVDEDGYICFLRENQGVWHCWCRPGDDAVYCDAESGRGVKNAQQIHESIDHFLITFCLQEAVMSSPEIVYLHDFSPPEGVVVAAGQELLIGGRYVYPSSPLDFYFAPHRRLLAMRTPLKDLWIAGYEAGLLDCVKNEIEAMQIQPRPPLGLGVSGEMYVGNSLEPKKSKRDKKDS
jgi:hypothetical protein